MKTIDKKKVFFRWLKSNNLWGHWCKCCYLYPSVDYTYENWEQHLREDRTIGVEFMYFENLIYNAPFVWNDSTDPKIFGFDSWEEVHDLWMKYANIHYKTLFLNP